MDQETLPKIEDYPPRYCPDCCPEAGYINMLFFLGIQPDGYVCKSCTGYSGEFDDELKKLAVVI